MYTDTSEQEKIEEEYDPFYYLCTGITTAFVFYIIMTVYCLYACLREGGGVGLFVCILCMMPYKTKKHFIKQNRLYKMLRMVGKTHFNLRGYFL